MSNVTAYFYPMKIELTFSINFVLNWNLPMNRTDFKIYQGIDNVIEFEIRNQDRKPIRLNGRSLIMTVLEPKTRKAINQIPLIVTDSSNGWAKVVIRKPVVCDWPEGYLMYTISVVDVDGLQRMIYTDQTQGVMGWFEFISGVLPEVIPTLRILTTDWEPQTWIPPWQQVPQSMWVAQSYPGNMQDGNLDGLHTINVFCTNFTGRFYIQASIDNAPPSDSRDWFDLITDPTAGPGKYYGQFSGIDVFNYSMNLMWLRFVWQPINQTRPNGQIDKILYRY